MTYVMEHKLQPGFQVVDGIKIPLGFSADNLRSALKYQPSKGDIFIDAFPKCGTNWTKFIVELLIGGEKAACRNGGYALATTFFELVGKERLAALPEPRIITSHLAYDLIPKSSGARYIYVVRNPKDCCVSYFYHTQKTKAYNFEHGTFEDFLQMFIRGETSFGDYFGHFSSWYPHIEEPNVLFLTYEGMKKDPEAAVLRIAKFLDVRDPDLLDPESNRFQEVVHDSSIDAMKEHFKASYRNAMGAGGVDQWTAKEAFPCGRAPPPPEALVRKGIIGDWRNHFTAEQSLKIEHAFFEKCGHLVDKNIWYPKDWLENTA